MATFDKEHVRQCIRAMKMGYDVLLEKPIRDEKEEIALLLKVQKETGRTVAVCHELRYGPEYEKLSELLKCGTIGTLSAIDAMERVAYRHQVQAYGRIQSDYKRRQKSHLPRRVGRKPSDGDCRRRIPTQWRQNDMCPQVRYTYKRDNRIWRVSIKNDLFEITVSENDGTYRITYAPRSLRGHTAHGAGGRGLRLCRVLSQRDTGSAHRKAAAFHCGKAAIQTARKRPLRGVSHLRQPHGLSRFQCGHERPQRLPQTGGHGAAHVPLSPKKEKPLLQKSLNLFIDFAKRESFDEETGEVFDGTGKNRKFIRLYNAPRLITLFTKMYILTGDKTYLEYCQKKHRFLLCGRRL